MKHCCICGKPPQWHHNLIFAAKAVQDPFAILPLCPEHHDEARNSDFKSLMDWVMLNRANSADLAKYSKVIDYKKRKQNLNKTFGTYTPEKIKKHYANNKHKDSTSFN